MRVVAGRWWPRVGSNPMLGEEEICKERPSVGKEQDDEGIHTLSSPEWGLSAQAGTEG